MYELKEKENIGYDHNYKPRERRIGTKHAFIIIGVFLLIFGLTILLLGCILSLSIGIYTATLDDSPCMVNYTIIHDSSCIDCIDCEIGENNCVKVVYNITWNPNCKFGPIQIYSAHEFQSQIDNFIDNLECVHLPIGDKCFNPYNPDGGITEREGFITGLIAPAILASILFIFIIGSLCYCFKKTILNNNDLV